MLPDLGVKGNRGILDAHEQLVSLGNKDNPVIVIGEEESKVKGKPWIEDDKVVAYIDSGHILCDLAST